MNIRRPALRTINTYLLAAIVLVNGYIIAVPVLPQLLPWSQKPDHQQVAALAQKIAPTTPGNPAPPAPRDNRLVIPSMALDQPVFTGNTMSTLKKGLWLRPQGSTPDKGSNTVIVGHRFTYTDPRGQFYHLDMVHRGDPIGLYWQGKTYRYTVTDIKTVKADHIEIEQPTENAQLTLYTCTPLWLPKDRLVVVAKLDTAEAAQ